MDDEIKRRDLIRGLGALSIGSLAGCNTLLGGRAQEIKEQANQTQQNLRSELSWSDYSLQYEPDSINIDTDRLGSTGVENASQYRINIKVALSSNSDDLDGWVATSERRAEFFSLLNDATYDIFRRASNDFKDYEPPRQPSNRNQVVEYQLRVDAESCSYLQDTVPAGGTDEILSSRSAYADYVNDGTDYEINIEKGFLGTDLFC